MHDGVTLPLRCFRDLTIYVIPENRKSNKYWENRKPGNNETNIYGHKFACKNVAQKKRKTEGKL